MKPIKLLIVYPRFLAGGEERVIVDLLKNFDRSKYTISLCLFEKTGEFLSEVPEDIQIYGLNKKNRWDAAFLVLKLSKLIDEIKPDIVLSALWYSTAVASVADWFCSHTFNFVAREPHNHKKDFPKNNLKDIAKRCIMNFAHKRPDIVISVSVGSAEDVSRSYKISGSKMRVVYNSVDNDKISKMADMQRRDDSNKKQIVTLGRLIPRKGFDVLIRSFCKVREQMDVKLIIIGEGPEKSNLQLLAKELGLSDSVLFLGYQDNPYSHIAVSDVFVCSSLWEGFGNVIIEAMACGVPVISTSCPFGPDEIITDGVNGLLVPVSDEGAMSEAILKLLSDEPLRIRLAEAGRKRAKDFTVEKNVLEHERIFCEVAVRNE